MRWYFHHCSYLVGKKYSSNIDPYSHMQVLTYIPTFLGRYLITRYPTLGTR